MWRKYENGRWMHRSLNPYLTLFFQSMGVGIALFTLLWLMAAI